MRLTSTQISVIRTSAAQLAGDAARVWLFGSRVRDDERGGDVDLLLELDVPIKEPAQLSARLAAQVSRAMYGWMEMRRLRNQMVHEYIEDLAVLASALRSGHTFVPTLVAAARRCVAEARRLLQA